MVGVPHVTCGRCAVCRVSRAACDVPLCPPHAAASRGACVCVRARVRCVYVVCGCACVRACVCACVRACVCACVYMALRVAGAIMGYTGGHASAAGGGRDPHGLRKGLHHG